MEPEVEEGHSPEWQGLIDIAIEYFENSILECGPSALKDSNELVLILDFEAETTFENSTLDQLMETPECREGITVRELQDLFLRDVRGRWEEVKEQRLSEIRKQWG